MESPRPGHPDLQLRTKELIVDFRNHQGTYTPISLSETPVEIVSCFSFLGLQISDDLAWTQNTEVMFKKAHQYLYPLWYHWKCGISTH